MIEEIYRLFLACPQARAALILRDGLYEGVLSKKDVELCIKEEEEPGSLWEKIDELPVSNLESALFAGRPRSKTLIPCLSPEGRALDPITYEEFISEFYPEDYRGRLSLIEIFQNYEHPLLILNRFKTVVYSNPAVEEMFYEDSLGKRIGALLADFIIDSKGDRVLVSRGGITWIMFVARSRTEHSLSYVYQFIPLED